MPRVALEVDLSCSVEGSLEGVIVGPDGAIAAEIAVPVAGPSSRCAATVAAVSAWGPDHPALYRIELRLLVGTVAVDSWSESFGFRSIETRDGKLLLNGEPLYLRGALDQDYYPEGICTPPSLAFLEGGNYATLPLPGALHVNSVQTYEAAGLAGMGLMQAALSGIRRHFESGALVEILPNFRPEPLDVSLVVAHRNNLSRRVRAFMQWIEEVLTPYLE